MLEARDYILMGGCELHREETRRVLYNAGLLTEEAEEILADQQLSNYMRYCLIRDMVSGYDFVVASTDFNVRGTWKGPRLYF